MASIMVSSGLLEKSMENEVFGVYDNDLIKRAYSSLSFVMKFKGGVE
jgi:hypothetical protein